MKQTGQALRDHGSTDASVSTAELLAVWIMSKLLRRADRTSHWRTWLRSARPKRACRRLKHPSTARCRPGHMIVCYCTLDCTLAVTSAGRIARATRPQWRTIPNKKYIDTCMPGRPQAQGPLPDHQHYHGCHAHQKARHCSVMVRAAAIGHTAAGTSSRLYVERIPRDLCVPAALRGSKGQVHAQRHPSLHWTIVTPCSWKKRDHFRAHPCAVLKVQVNTAYLKSFRRRKTYRSVDV